MGDRAFESGPVGALSKSQFGKPGCLFDPAGRSRIRLLFDCGNGQLGFPIARLGRARGGDLRRGSRHESFHFRVPAASLIAWWPGVVQRGTAPRGKPWRRFRALPDTVQKLCCAPRSAQSVRRDGLVVPRRTSSERGPVRSAPPPGRAQSVQPGVRRAARCRAPPRAFERACSASLEP
jgi:hypothetical protein